METTHIVGGIASLAVLALGIFFNEVIKEGIKKSFSDLSPQRMRGVFVILAIACLALAYGAGFGITKAVAGETNVVPEATIDNVDEYQNDSIQAAVEVAKVIIDEVDESLEAKRTRDSITLANREKYWVYRIGNPKDDESAVWDAAMEIKSIGDISIFKEGRKSYTIICDPGFNEQTMRDSLSSYEARLDLLGVNYRLELIDLMSYCSKKESLIETEPIKRKKHDESFKCLTCDK
jgi:hypothetical protein